MQSSKYESTIFYHKKTDWCKCIQYIYFFKISKLVYLLNFDVIGTTDVAHMLSLRSKLGKMKNGTIEEINIM